MSYHYQHFNPDDLSVLFLGFQRKLFTRPREKEVLTIELDEWGAGCILFFENDYLFRLTQEYLFAKNSGKFASSNAANKWLRVLSLLEAAVLADRTQYAEAKDYSIIIQYFDS